MPSSRRRRPPETFAEQAVALAWGAWTELGVAGWPTTTHGNWAIDPEPLILFTAGLRDADPRLRDESTDWCIHNWRFVSKVRLKNLIRQQPEDVRDAFGEFAATVNIHAGVTWPGASQPRSYRTTGRSARPTLDRPSLAWLRLRAMFGLGARTEILRYFLSGPGMPASVARLAAAVGYTKRNVAEECETLRQAGVLAVRVIGNRFYYKLARRSLLEGFVGEMPDVRPPWTALFNVARELVNLEEQADRAPSRTLPVHVRKAARRMEDDLGELDVEATWDDVRGSALWPAVRTFGQAHLGAWSIGEWRSEEAARVPST